jgi:hypothetical protein
MLNPKPASLNDVSIRFTETVRYSEESLGDWADAIGTSKRRLNCIIAGTALHERQGPSKLRPKDLLAIDDLCAGHFLTPPERQYAEKARARSIATAARKQRYYK